MSLKYTVYTTRKAGRFVGYRSMPVDARQRTLKTARELLAKTPSSDFPAFITPLGAPNEVLDYRTGVVSL